MACAQQAAPASASGPQQPQPPAPSPAADAADRLNPSAGAPAATAAQADAGPAPGGKTGKGRARQKAQLAAGKVAVDQPSTRSVHGEHSASLNAASPAHTADSNKLARGSDAGSGRQQAAGSVAKVVSAALPAAACPQMPASGQRSRSRSSSSSRQPWAAHESAAGGQAAQVAEVLEQQRLPKQPVAPRPVSGHGSEPQAAEPQGTLQSRAFVHSQAEPPSQQQPPVQHPAAAPAPQAPPRPTHARTASSGSVSGACSSHGDLPASAVDNATIPAPAVGRAPHGGRSRSLPVPELGPPPRWAARGGDGTAPRAVPAPTWHGPADSDDVASLLSGTTRLTSLCSRASSPEASSMGGSDARSEGSGQSVGSQDSWRCAVPENPSQFGLQYNFGGPPLMYFRWQDPASECWA